MSTLKPHPPGLHTKIEYMYSGFSHIFRNIIFLWFSKMYQLCHLGFFSFCSVQIQINVVKLRYIYISGCFDLVFTCRLSKFKSLNSVWKDKCHFSIRWEIKYFLLFFLYQFKYLTLWNEKKDNINITLFKANNFFFYYYFIPDGAKFYQFFDSQLRSPSQGRQQRFYMYISPLTLTLVRRAGG